jgi:cytochrome c biogenesis protein
MTATKTSAPDQRRNQNGRTGRGPAPKLGIGGALRFLWTQLTAMRTALILLFLLALGAIPGSLLPQRSISTSEVKTFFDQHPVLAPIYDKADLFNVYTSPWFSAIYLLLFISLMGCIIPRIRAYVRLLRAPPPKTPRFLHRMPVYRSYPITPAGTSSQSNGQHAGSAAAAPAGLAPAGNAPSETADQEAAAGGESPEPAISGIAQRLRTRHYRVAVKPDGSVSAERGYLREAGNLLFHVSLVVLLAGVAVFWLTNFHGTSKVVVGDGFSNTLAQYDDFKAGPLFSDHTLSPFTIRVNHFDVKFETGKVQHGAARKFSSDVTVTDHPGAKPHHETLKVNEPLNINGSRVHLLSWGYAPVIKVTDAHHKTVFSGPVVFLPKDANFTSAGAISAPDGKPDRLGFEGIFSPSAVLNQQGPHSIFPDTLNPELYLNAWYGKRGSSDGGSSSVYSLDTNGMTQIKDPTKPSQPYRFYLRPGQSRKLPGGKGTIKLTGVKRWVKLQVSDSPGAAISLVSIGAAVLGLCLSLFIRPRRVWARIRTTDGRRMLEIAGLDKADARTGLDSDLDGVADDLGLANRGNTDEADKTSDVTQANRHRRS